MKPYPDTTAIRNLGTLCRRPELKQLYNAMRAGKSFETAHIAQDLKRQFPWDQNMYERYMLEFIFALTDINFVRCARSFRYWVSDLDARNTKLNASDADLVALSRIVYAILTELDNLAAHEPAEPSHYVTSESISWRNNL